MRCGAVHNLMVEFAADGIAPAREAEFRAHLASCAKCRAEWAEIEEANALLASYDLAMPDDAFFQRLTHAVMAATEQQPVRRPAFRLRWAGAGALACLVLAVGFWHQTGGPQPTPLTPASPVATGLALPELAAEPAPASAPEPTRIAAAAPMPAAAPAPKPATTHHAPASHVAIDVPPPEPVAKPAPSAVRPPARPQTPTVPPPATSAADAATSLPPRVALSIGGRSAVMAALAAAVNETAEPGDSPAASETLVLAMAPEVQDLGTSTLVVQPSEPPAAEHKRSVSPAVSVVGATLVPTEREPNQP